MAENHSLLKRQLKRHLGAGVVLPPEWQAFVDGVNEAYRGFDADRAMLERSLDLSSQELFEANAEMRAVFQAIPDLMLRLNQQRTVLDVKAGASGELTIGRQDFLGKRLEDTPLSDVAPHFAAGVGRVIAESAPVIIEYSTVRQGKDSDYEARFVPLREKEIVVIIRDITERKQTLRLLAAAALREREVEFHGLAEAMPQMVWITRPDGWNIYFNQQWVDYTGLTLEESLGHGWNKPFHPEDQQRTSDAWHLAVATSGIYSIECRLRRADGTYRWWLVRGVPQLDASGKILKWFGTCTDIHELKLAEEELRRSEALLQIAGRTARLGGWAVDLPEVRLTWSDEVCAIHEVPPGTVPGLEQALNFYASSSRGTISQAVDACTRLGTPFDLELEIVTAKGRRVWVRAIGEARRNAAGAITRVQGAYQDITERRLAVETLRQSEERFSGAFEYASIGVALLSRGGRWLKVNQALCDLTGYSKPELLARSFQDITHPADLADDLEYLRRMLAGEIRTFRMEKRYLHARGHFVPVLINVSLVSDGQGQPQYFISQIQDITERKLAEAALEKAHKELVGASRMAGMAEFATGILHNVGNVLNSVNVASTCVADSLRRSKAASLSKVVALLREHENDLGDFFTRNPKGRLVPNFLAQLAEQLAREQAGALKELAELQKNIEHIKDIVTSQQGMAKSSNLAKAVNVTELVEDAVRINLTGVARHKIDVIKACADLPQVRLEKSRVLQILVNLVRNAKQACAASDRLDKKLTICTTAGSGCVRIAVTDNGVGIPAENLARIFTHGFTTKQDGHGFGLNSAALAAKDMRGSLSVQSEGPGLGATFILELPLTPDPPAPEDSVR